MTGWLRIGVPAEWTDVIRMALFDTSVQERQNMAYNGKKTVMRNFSKEKMAERLESELRLLPPPGEGGIVWIVCGFIVLILSILVAMVF